MQTLTAIYKGKRRIELEQDIDVPDDTEVLVLIPSMDESEMQGLLRDAADVTFKKLWDNDGDEVWNAYL